MLSATCKAAIKAVILLASNEDDKLKLSVKDISEAIDASSHTIGKILQTLVRQGIIKSTKGPTGGFFMTDAQKNQALINVVEAIDGKQIFSSCGLGLQQCSEDHPCPIHDQYKDIRDSMISLFNENKILDMCYSVNGGTTYLIG